MSASSKNTSRIVLFRGIKSCLISAIFISLFCGSVSSLSGQAISIGDWYEDYESFRERFALTDASTVREFKKEALDLKRKVDMIRRMPEGDRFLHDYLEGLVLSSVLEADLFLLAGDGNDRYDGVPVNELWCAGMDKLETLKDNIEDLRTIITRAKAKNEEELLTKFQELKGSQLREMKMDSVQNGDRAFFRQRVMEPYEEDYPLIIDRLERFLFRIMTDRGTVLQYRNFIQFAIYDNYSRDTSLYNPYARDAFWAYFTLLTSTGDPQSFAVFDRYHIHNNLNSLLKNLFENTVRKRREYAFQFSPKVSLVNYPVQPADQDELLTIMRDHPNMELAVIALHRYMEARVRQGAWTSLINDLKVLVTNLPFESRLARHINATITWLLDRRGKERPGLAIPLKEMKFQDGIPYQMLYSADSTFAAVSFGQRQNIDRYEVVGKNGVEFVQSIQQQDTDQYLYVFDTPNMDNRNDPKPLKAYSLTSSPLLFDSRLSSFFRKYGLFRDLSFSREHGLAFFVAPPVEGIPNKVGVSENNCDLDELETPYFREPLRFQGEDYHGQAAGNSNTDIYYIFREDNTWIGPRLLTSRINPVNTPFAERSPILSADGTRLYFASEGHPGLGRMDIYSVRIEKIPGAGFQNPSLTISSAVNNEVEFNSAGNDLFFTPSIGPEEGGFWISDREGPVHFYCADCSAGKIYNPKFGTLGPPIELGSPVFYEVRCDTLWRFSRFPIEDGLINVVGRIYNEDTTLAKRAEIFFSNSSGEGGSYEIDLYKRPLDTIYRVQIPENRNYIVNVFTYNEEGDTLVSLTQSFVLTCSNDLDEDTGGARTTVIDMRSNEITAAPVLDVTKDDPGSDETVLDPLSEPLNVLPVFFGFDERTLDSNLINYEQLRNNYRQLVETVRNRSSAMIFLHGYADVQGEPAYNVKLSKDRAMAVRTFLHEELKFPLERIKIIPFGSVSRYNGEDMKPYRQYFDSETFSALQNKPQQRDFQMNRRVELHIQYDNDQEIPNK